MEPSVVKYMLAFSSKDVICKIRGVELKKPDSIENCGVFRAPINEGLSFDSQGVGLEKILQLSPSNCLPKDISVSSISMKIESKTTSFSSLRINVSPPLLILKFVCKKDSGNCIRSFGSLFS